MRDRRRIQRLRRKKKWKPKTRAGFWIVAWNVGVKVSLWRGEGLVGECRAVNQSLNARVCFPS